MSDLVVTVDLRTAEQKPFLTQDVISLGGWLTEHHPDIVVIRRTFRSDGLRIVASSTSANPELRDVERAVSYAIGAAHEGALDSVSRTVVEASAWHSGWTKEGGAAVSLGAGAE